jgi:tol-pal system protein YbgF
MRTKVMVGMLSLAATALWVSPSGAFSLDFLTGKHNEHKHAPVVLAQASDAEMQVQQLQEQLRQLNGRVEEMSYQLLQMQEQLRKAQEDNEFRFQQLEGGKKKSSNETVPSTNDAANASGDTTPGADQNTQNDQTSDTATLDQPTDDNGSVVGEDNNNQNNGKAPVDLGQLKLDQNGKVLGADQDSQDSVKESDLPPPDTSTENKTASLDNGNDDPQYQAAYEQILSGDYASAEAGFAEFISNHPKSKRIADANFWMGEAQYSQGKFSDAAKTFLDGYKSYGKSAKAPEMLLKLAMSLAKLDSKDTACATLRQVPKAYPKASRAVISKVASEQKRLAC